MKPSLKKINSNINSSKIQDESRRKKTLVFVEDNKNVERKTFRSKTKKLSNKSSISCKSFRSLKAIDSTNRLETSRNVKFNLTSSDEIPQFKSFRN